MKKTKKYNLIRELCEIIIDEKDYNLVSVNEVIAIAVSIWQLLLPEQSWLSEKEDKVLYKELTEFYGDND